MQLKIGRMITVEMMAYRLRFCVTLWNESYLHHLMIKYLRQLGEHNIFLFVLMQLILVCFWLPKRPRLGELYLFAQLRVVTVSFHLDPVQSGLSGSVRRGCLQLRVQFRRRKSLPWLENGKGTEKI